MFLTNIVVEEYSAFCKGSAASSREQRRCNRLRITARMRERSRQRYRAVRGSKLSRHLRRTDGANTPSAWRERPRAWPPAWQAKRPFRVVAHATRLLLATARAEAVPGGRHRAPPEALFNKSQCWLQLSGGASRAALRSTHVESMVEGCDQRGNTSRESLFPLLFPPLFPLLWITVSINGAENVGWSARRSMRLETHQPPLNA